MDDKAEEILKKASKIDPGNLRKKRKRDGEAIDTEIFVEQKVKKAQKLKYAPQDLLDQIIQNNLNDAMSIYNYFQGKTRQLSNEQSKFYEQIVRATIYNTRLSLVDILGNKSFKYYLCPDIGYTNESDIFTNDRLYWLSMAQRTLANNELFPILKFDKMAVSLQSIAKAVSKDYYKGFTQDYDKDFSFIGNKVLVNKDDNFGDIKNFTLEGVQELYPEVSLTEFTYEGKEYKSLNFKNGSCLVALKTAFDNADELKKKIEAVNIIDSKKDLKEGVKVVELKDEDSIFFSQEFKLVDFAPCFIAFQNGTNIPFSFLFTLEFDMIALENYLYKKNKNAEEIGGFVNIRNLVNWDTFGLFVNFLMVESVTRFKNENEKLRKKIGEFIKEWEKGKIYFSQIKVRAIRIIKYLTKFFDSFQTKISLEVLKNLSDQFNVVYKDYNVLHSAKYVIRIRDLILKYRIESPCAPIINFISDVSTYGKLSDIMSWLKDLFNDVKQLETTGNIVEKIKNICKKIFVHMITTKDGSYWIPEIRTPSCVLGDINNTQNFTSESAEKKVNEEIEKKGNQMKLDVELISKINDVPVEKAVLFLIGDYFSQKLKEDLNNYFLNGDKNSINKDEGFYLWTEERKDLLNKYYDDNSFASAAKYNYLTNGLNIMDLTADKNIQDKLSDLLGNYNVYINKLKIEAEQDDLKKKEKKNNEKIEEEEIAFVEKGMPITDELLKKMNIKIKDEILNNEKNKALIEFARKNGITDDVLVTDLKRYIVDNVIGIIPEFLEGNTKLFNKLKEDTLGLHGKESVQAKHRVKKKMRKSGDGKKGGKKKKDDKKSDKEDEKEVVEEQIDKKE